MKKVVYFLMICSIFACQNSENKSSGEHSQKPMPSIYPNVSNAEEKRLQTFNQTKDTVAKATPEQVFALNQYTVTSRKIIRTAQVKTKVKNTEGATYQIEQMAQKWHGYVTANNLENRIVKQEELPLSADSMLQIRHTEAVNTLIVRVPNQKLDTFLTDLSRIYEHLEYRRVNANDLTATFLTNQLKSQYRNQSSQRIAAATDEKGKRLDDIVRAEERRVQLSDEAIAQQVQNVETDYDIAFSTVNIEIYADAAVSKTVVPYISTTVSRANFGFRCQQALANGWFLLLDIFVGILNLWLIILIAFISYALYRRMGYPKRLLRKELDTPQ